MIALPLESHSFLNNGEAGLANLVGNYSTGRYGMNCPIRLMFAL